MNAFAGLTPEQVNFANHPAEAFVQACPGAGKTRTIVARLVKIGETLLARKGIAVLSFTNSAVDEFKQRCFKNDYSGFLKHPHYVGTFDSFVRHFIVMPSGISQFPQRPTILDSWDTLGVEIRLAGQFSFAGPGVSLDLFHPTTNAIEPARIGNNGLQAHVAQQRERYMAAAAALRQNLHNAGYLSTACARVRAEAYIDDAQKSAALGRALAARFHEILVDEGQDCNPSDLIIVAWLRNLGIRVTIVSDRDQSIYNFREGDPANLQELCETYDANNRLDLTGNFRSTPAICRLAATLRARADEDRALGEHATNTQPVVLITYPGAASETIGAAFVPHLQACGLGRADAIVLAHGRNVARRAAGDNASGEEGSTKIQAVARAVSEFWSNGATPKSREDTLKRLETALLDAMELRLDHEHVSRALRRLGIDTRAFRRQSLSLVMALPKACPNTENDREAWIDCVREQIEKLGLPIPQGKTIRGVFRKPPNDSWSALLASPAPLSMRSGKIHEAKGREYKAVCVVIPPNRGPKNHTQILMDAWQQRTDSEPKRVIYVGATRAQILLGIAVPRPFGDACAAILAAGNVVHVRQNL